MARPNKSLRDYWRKEMEYADRVWEEAGWKQSAKSGVAHGQELATLYLDAYRGMQWNGMGWMRLPEEELSVTPLFFSSANTFTAGLIARSPEVTVLPRRPAVAEAARKWESVLNYDIYELKMKRQWKRAVFDAFFCPFGLTRHGFTPSVEYDIEKKNENFLIEHYAGSRPDKPWVRRWTLWDFRLDPLAETPDSDGDARWCAFRTLLTKEQIEQNPSMTLPKDLKATLRMAMPSPRGALRAQKKDTPPEELFEVWSIYDKRDRTWLQVDGTYEHILRPQAEWPIPWEDLPYDALYFNGQADTLFPIPYAQSIWPTIVKKNKLRTMMDQLVFRLRRIVIANEALMGKDQADRLEEADLTEIIRVQGEIANAIGEVGLGSFPQELMMYDGLLTQDIREALGQSAMDRAQRINVESATEAAGVAAGSQTAASRNIDALEDWLDSNIRHYAIARRATTADSEVVPILGSDDARLLIPDLAQEFLTVSKKDLAAEVDFIIRQGSTLPDTRQRRVQQALADIQVASGQPQIHNLQEVYANYWRAAGRNVTKVMLNAKQIAATAQPQVPGEEPQAQDASQLIQSLMGSQVQ